ncbi:hypothetical protein [Amycolatopsis sp. NBC_00348]|uniref:hypothetical protein n=1 Tax=Amycolatopsis sp. NBC_00348 TaxID=2975956 RepID=UPI002E272803
MRGGARGFLRTRLSATGEVTGEACVAGERDRHAGDRAVADWARAILEEVRAAWSAATRT